jgi:flagellar hook-basal body complex protein FliE
MMMHVEPLVPDVAADAPMVTALPSAGGSFGDLVDAAGGVLAKADDAERAFAAHRGGLQEMVVERARADIALQIATAGAQRVTQGLQTILGMQI